MVVAGFALRFISQYVSKSMSKSIRQAVRRLPASLFQVKKRRMWEEAAGVCWVCGELCEEVIEGYNIHIACPKAQSQKKM